MDNNHQANGEAFFYRAVLYSDHFKKCPFELPSRCIFYTYIYISVANFHLHVTCQRLYSLYIP